MQQAELDIALNSGPGANLASCSPASCSSCVSFELSAAVQGLICIGHVLALPHLRRVGGDNSAMQMEVTRVVFVAKTEDKIALQAQGRSGSQYGNVVLCLGPFCFKLQNVAASTHRGKPQVT